MTTRGIYGKRSTIFLFTALLVFCHSAIASYREACTVKYQTQNGWSSDYKVQCNYITGAELNNATSTFGYQAFSTYAVIFWDQNQASVLRLNGIFICGTEASNGCAISYIPIIGIDQQGRTWKVCGQNLYWCP